MTPLDQTEGTKGEFNADAIIATARTGAESWQFKPMLN
jgi:hypothetical protein